MDRRIVAVPEFVRRSLEDLSRAHALCTGHFHQGRLERIEGRHTLPIDSLQLVEKGHPIKRLHSLAAHFGLANRNLVQFL